jgi:CheY-like chemotaxis protein
MVLVLDDDPKWFELMEAALAKLGHVAIHVADGDAALAMLKTNPRISGALIDLRLPGIDGREVAARIRDDKTVRTIPFVFMSAQRPDEATAMEPLMLGAFDFVSKDLGPNEVAEAIHIAIEATRVEAAERAALKGDKGDKGDTGERGQKGDKGERGPQGKPG